MFLLKTKYDYFPKILQEEFPPGLKSKNLDSKSHKANFKVVIKYI